MLYYNKYKWLGVFFMQKDEYCNWFMTNQATDGTKGYKTDCGCLGGLSLGISIPAAVSILRFY